MSKPNCYECKFRGQALGSSHSTCRYEGNEIDIFDFMSTKNIENANLLDIKAIQHGVDSGWFNWPVDFDPIWLVNCEGFYKI